MAENIPSDRRGRIKPLFPNIRRESGGGFSVFVLKTTFMQVVPCLEVLRAPDVLGTVIDCRSVYD
jgi:hypothetical protein